MRDVDVVFQAPILQQRSCRFLSLGAAVAVKAGAIFGSWTIFRSSPSRMPPIMTVAASGAPDLTQMTHSCQRFCRIACILGSDIKELNCGGLSVVVARRLPGLRLQRQDNMISL